MAILSNDYFKVKELIDNFDDVFDEHFDPLESILGLHKFNNHTASIVMILLDNFEFPTSSEYLELLLNIYQPKPIYKRILDLLLENSNFEVSTLLITLAQTNGVFDIIINKLRKLGRIDTILLNLLKLMPKITKQICETELIGNIIILETDKGIIWTDRDTMEVNKFYRFDPEYSILNDGVMNLEFPIYRISVMERIFFLDELEFMKITDKQIITFSSYLDKNILVVRIDECPDSIDLFVFIGRDKCEMYL